MKGREQIGFIAKTTITGIMHSSTKYIKKNFKNLYQERSNFVSQSYIIFLVAYLTMIKYREKKLYQATLFLCKHFITEKMESYQREM